jgi:hypothetical protein
MKCNYPDILELFLSKFSCTKEDLPNGQHKYTFPDELVVNVYATGSVVYQGSNISGQTANRIAEIINCINKA